MCEEAQKAIIEHYKSLAFRWVEVKDYDISGCLVEAKTAGCRLVYIKLVRPDGSEIYIYEPPSIIIVSGRCLGLVVVSEARLRVLALRGPLGPRELKALHRLLRRHGARILAVALVVELEDPRQAEPLARAYHAKPLQVPPQLLLEQGGG